MKIVTRYLAYVQAAIMSFILIGCSSVNTKNVYTAKEPTVSDYLAEVIAAAEISEEDNLAKEPSSVLQRPSPINSNNSIWMSNKIVYPSD